MIQEQRRIKKKQSLFVSTKRRTKKHKDDFMFLPPPGTGVAVPLTVLQALAARSSFGTVHLPPEQLLVNAGLAIAIYGKDRLEERDMDGLSWTRASALATAFYLRSEWTLGVLVLFLHLEYSSIKKQIAPVKPFFVSAFWTLAAAEPELVGDTSHHRLLSPTVLAWVFCLALFLSHSADIPDIDEDEKDGILTPAVRMGGEMSSHWAVSIALASICIHPACPHYDRLDSAVDVGILLSALELVVPSVLYRLVSWSLLVAVCVATYRFRLDIANAFFLSTETPHTHALSSAVRLSNWAQTLPYERKELVLHTLGHALEWCDSAGHQVVRLYSKLLQVL